MDDTSSTANLVYRSQSKPSIPTKLEAKQQRKQRNKEIANKKDNALLVNEAQLMANIKEINIERKRIGELPKPFLSIDPGLVNFAHVYGHYQVFLDDKLIILYLNPKRVATQALFDPRQPIDIELWHRTIKSWIHTSFSDEELKNCLAVIEHQFQSWARQHWGSFGTMCKLNTVQCILFTLLDSTPGVFATFINPRECRNQLGIAQKTDSGATTKQSKSLAFCRTLFQSQQDYDRCINTDHEADALDQAYFYFKKYMSAAHEVQFSFKIVVGDHPPLQ